MSKIILVETVSTFRHVYAIELEDNQPSEYALDDVVTLCTHGEIGLQEVSQNHIGEDIFSYREVSEEEYLKIFDKENDYLKDWEPVRKKEFIYKQSKDAGKEVME
jgi:hypothetical protein